MDRKEVKALFRKVLAMVFLGHFGVSFLHMLAFYLGHPLFDSFNESALWLQIVVVSLWAFVAYVIVGLIVGAPRKDQPLFYLLLDRAFIYLALFLIVTYGLVFVSTFWVARRNIWLIYSLLNALFGTYMYRLPEALILSPWWAVSTVIPSLAMFVGAFVRMHFEERNG